MVSDGAVVVLLEVVVVLVGMVVVLRAVVVLLTAVDVDSCVESPPQPARTMATAKAPNSQKQRALDRDSIGSDRLPGPVAHWAPGSTARRMP